VTATADRQNLIRVMPAQGGGAVPGQHHHPPFDVAVIGGGVIGLAIAWRAQQRGLRTLLLERDALAQGSSHAAAGMLAPVSEATASEHALFALGRASAARYPAFVEELRAASGHDPGYLACGTLAVARDRDEAEALERERAVCESFGFAVQRLRPSEARRVEPALAPTLRLALQIPDDHAIDPRRLCAALAAAVRRAGGTIREHVAVAGLDVAGDRVTGVLLADGELVAAERVVVAAGAWRACPTRRACRSVPSRDRSCGCAIPPDPACCATSCGWTPATSCRAATAATCSARRWRSAASTPT
jgi:glycine oxidase